MSDFTMYRDAELPAIPFAWKDRDDALIDYSSGWTFRVQLCNINTKTIAAFTKTTGITGAATSPNVVVAFTADELAAVAAGRYQIKLRATRTADSLARDFRPGNEPELTLVAASAAAP